MAINPIQMLESVATLDATNFNALGASQMSAQNSSMVQSSMFAEKISSVDSQIKTSDSLAARYIQGEDIAVHDLMISMGKAKTELQLLVEVRNKLLEAYQEISKIQL